MRNFSKNTIKIQSKKIASGTWYKGDSEGHYYATLDNVCWMKGKKRYKKLREELMIKADKIWEKIEAG